MKTATLRHLKNEALQNGFLDAHRQTPTDQSPFLRGLDDRIRQECANIAAIDPSALPAAADTACYHAAAGIEATMREQERLCLACGEEVAPRRWRRLGARLLLFALLIFDGTMLKPVLERILDPHSETAILEGLFYSYGVAVVLLGTLFHLLGRQLRLLSIATRRLSRAGLIAILGLLSLGILGTAWALRCGIGEPELATAGEVGDPVPDNVSDDDPGNSNMSPPKPLRGGMRVLLAGCLGASFVIGTALGYVTPLSGVVSLRLRSRPGAADPQSKHAEPWHTDSAAFVVDLCQRRRLWRDERRRLKGIEALQVAHCDILSQYYRGATLASVLRSALELAPNKLGLSDVRKDVLEQPAIAAQEAAVVMPPWNPCVSLPHANNGNPA